MAWLVTGTSMPASTVKRMPLRAYSELVYYRLFL
jgi:hypothetical protein